MSLLVSRQNKTETVSIVHPAHFHWSLHLDMPKLKAGKKQEQLTLERRKAAGICPGTVNSKFCLVPLCGFPWAIYILYIALYVYMYIFTFLFSSRKLSKKLEHALVFLKLLWVARWNHDLRPRSVHFQNFTVFLAHLAEYTLSSTNGHSTHDPDNLVQRYVQVVDILDSRSFATPVFRTYLCELSKRQNYGKTQHFAQFLPAKTSLLSNIDAARPTGNFQYSRKLELLNFLW